MTGIAASTAVSTGDYIDMTGYEGAVFTALTGPIVTTGTCTYTLHESSATTSTGSAVTGATVIATTATVGAVLSQVNTIEFTKPIKRYVRLRAVTVTANGTIGGAACRQYGGKKQPPATGTAATAQVVVAGVST